ncbi:hypothetical protein GSI_09161 [Ganoderma sinense ZZ0214-1]|uniref:Uncharacterized protein n=1 Tax=Ganoderma sinense ZZ0214-1 TaxID=1077348 RepID=A0A2G8S5S2_9APHY|nr:hypothetical protein GSI_09161 [Ganoderma sinense ZZ0214-1]
MAYEPPENECWVRVPAVVNSNQSHLRDLRVANLSPEVFPSNQSGLLDHGGVNSGTQRPFNAACDR